MKRILLINHYAGSPQMGMEFRPYYMAKAWAEMGHEVLIVAATHSHVRTHQPGNKMKYFREEIEGVDYLWVRTPAYMGNGLRRFLNMLAFVFRLGRYSKTLLKQFRPDVVIASSTYPLDIYPARKIAQLAQARLLFEVHDLWPLSPMELGGMSRFHPFILTMQRGENAAYRVADRVISMLPAAKSHMLEHGLQEDKFTYIPNGVNLDEWQADIKLEAKHSMLLSDLRKKGQLIVGYAGAHGTANSLGSFIDAAKLVAERNISIVLVGQGPEKNRLIELVKEKSLTNVHFLSPVSKNQIPALLKQMDVLFIGLQKQPLFRFGISPNKLMDYMMAEKPIIQAIEAGNDMVGQANCGLSIEAENPVALEEAMLVLKNLSQDERDQMGKRGKEFVIENHEYSVLAKKFIGAMS